MFSRSRTKPSKSKAEVELSVFQNPSFIPGERTSGQSAQLSETHLQAQPSGSPPPPPVLLIPELDNSFPPQGQSGVYNSLSGRPNGSPLEIPLRQSAGPSEISLLRQDQDFDEPLFRTETRRRHWKTLRITLLIGGSVLSTILALGLTFTLLQRPISKQSNSSNPTPESLSNSNSTGNHEDMDEDPKVVPPQQLRNTNDSGGVPKIVKFPIPDLRTRVHEEFKAILLLGQPGPGSLIKPDGNASLSQSGSPLSILPISAAANASVVAEGISAGTEALRQRQTTEERIEKLGFSVSVSGAAENGSGPDMTRNQFYSYETLPQEEGNKIHQLSLIGFSMVRASRIIAKRLNLSKAEAEDGIILDVEAKVEPSAWCTAQTAHTFDRNCNTTEEYRLMDGKCNNLNHPQWGSTLQPYRRILGSDFGDDGISNPRKSSDGVRALPNAKVISNSLFSQRRSNASSTLSLLFPMWAEFIERDMTEIVPSSGENNSRIGCCENGKLLEIQHPECFPILLSPEDEFYDRVGQTCISVVRSAAAPTCSFGPREQFNLQSAYIDGSTIYDGVGMSGGRHQDGKIGSADSSLNFIWTKHHNGLVDQLSAVNPHWSGTRLFEEARRIVVAEIQHITFKEYLPLLLGNELILRAGLRLLESGYYEGYDKLVDPGIANVLASTASMFRLSMIPELEEAGRDPLNGTEQTKHPVRADLRPNLFLPGRLNSSFLESVLRDSLFNRSGATDTSFSQQITSGGYPAEGGDWAAIVIQRGRDHGIPAYSHWRQLCGLKEVHNFSDLDGVWDTADSIQRAQNVYNIFDDVDLYVGGLAEIREGNASVGPTFACLLADQFLRLRKGDRFWYEGDIQIKPFTPAQLVSIRNVTLSGILCQVFGTLGAIQGHGLQEVSEENLILPCQTLVASSYLNFSAWKEEKPIPGIQFPLPQSGIELGQFKS